MTAIDDPTSEPGAARSPGVTYQQLLDADTHPVPDVLRLESPRYLGSEDVPIERYTSREYHRAEVDHLWSKVWQFACREEHIPDVGDYVKYDIAELSFLVVRAHEPTEDDHGLRAYPNSCLHRGRILKEYDQGQLLLWLPARRRVDRVGHGFVHRLAEELAVLAPCFLSQDKAW